MTNNLKSLDILETDYFLLFYKIFIYFFTLYIETKPQQDNNASKAEGSQPTILWQCNL